MARRAMSSGTISKRRPVWLRTSMPRDAPGDSIIRSSSYLILSAAVVRIRPLEDAMASFNSGSRTKPSRTAKWRMALSMRNGSLAIVPRSG